MPFKRSRILFITLLAVLCFGAGLFLGKVWQIRDLVTDEKGAVEIVKVMNLYSKSRSPEVKFDQFWDVWNKIEAKYVDQPVDDVKLFYGAIQGAVAGLGDPYTVYFPPKKAEEFVKDLAGEFDGIGAEIGLKNEILTVIAPLAGSPAEKAGLKSGDKIYKIDNDETYGLSVDEAVMKIRGKKGTSVKLTISHDGLEKVEEITIVRDTIVVPTVVWEKKDNQIAYLRVSYFNEDTWSEFDKIAKEIKAWSPKGMVLDMRGNPGGYLDSSIAVASEWIKKGVVVKEKFSDGKENSYETVGSHRFGGLPTVVLIDEGTASGSEIVAGALQDYGLAKLVGNKSYGKGSVQDFEVLPDGSAIKITVARWYTPKDRQIDKSGIEPDVKIKEMFVKNGEKYDDKGLEKALELLKITN